MTKISFSLPSIFFSNPHSNISLSFAPHHNFQVLLSLLRLFFPPCVFRSRVTKNSREEYNKITLKKTPPNFFLSISPTAAVILNYFLWPFAIIKSSFEPFVYSARLFLLLIDFLLHIMGIQIRIKA